MKATIVLKDNTQIRWKLEHDDYIKERDGWLAFDSYDLAEPPIYMFERDTCGSIDVILLRAELPWFMYPLIWLKVHKYATIYPGWGDICKRDGLRFIPYEHHKIKED